MSVERWSPVSLVSGIRANPPIIADDTAVSAGSELRLKLRNLVCKYIENNITFYELDYQPDEN